MRCAIADEGIIQHQQVTNDNDTQTENRDPVNLGEGRDQTAERQGNCQIYDVDIWLFQIDFLQIIFLLRKL